MSYDTGAVSPGRQKVETDGVKEKVREIDRSCCFFFREHL